MKYRNYGKTGYRVSHLGYGVMRLPCVDGKVDRPAAVNVLRHAYEAGVNFFDSHHNYHDGDSETLIGEALSDVRDKIVIQTKCPYYTPETPGNTYMDRLKLALRKLKTDHVDFLLAHSIDPEPWSKHGDNWLKFAQAAKREGLTRYVGFSSHAPVDWVTRMIESGDFDAILVPYNLIETRYAPVLVRARALGIGTSVMNPVAGGRLGPPNTDLMQAVDRPAEDTTEIALRFAFANPDINVVVSGMTKPEWVTQNAGLAALDRPLPPDQEAKIQRVVAEKEALANLYCTGCRYCMPCPHGVEIPFNFYLMNMYNLFGLKDWVPMAYRSLKAKREKETDPLRASACTQCGRCEPKCPNKIRIIEQLKDVARRFEP